MDYIWGDTTHMECGCIFEETETGYIMHWCPKHKASDDMYEALKKLVGTYDELTETKRLGMPPEFGMRMCELVKALAKADGK